MEAEAAGDEALEIVLPEKAELTRLPEALLAPRVLPSLWTDDDNGEAGSALPVATLLNYFAGGHVATIPAAHYDDMVTIPACSEDTVLGTVEHAVELGTVWLTNPPATSWKEPVPAGALNDSATLRPPPDRLTPQDLLSEALRATAWQDDAATGLASRRRSRKTGQRIFPGGSCGMGSALRSTPTG